MHTTHRITAAIVAAVLSLAACSSNADGGTTTVVTATDENIEDCSGPATHRPDSDDLDDSDGRPVADGAHGPLDDMPCG